jgi:DNA-binding winged helix-turn-helix (wHTH) protein
LPVGVLDLGHFKLHYDPGHHKPKVRLVGVTDTIIGLSESDYRLLLNLYQRNGRAASAEKLGYLVFPHISSPPSSAYRGMRNIRLFLRDNGYDAERILVLGDDGYAFAHKKDVKAAPAQTKTPKLRT